MNSCKTISPATAFRTPNFMRLAIYMASVVEWNLLIGFVELRCLEDQNPVGVVGHVLRAGELVDTGETAAEDAARAFARAEPAPAG
jgi:hypothetical protein